MKLLLGMNALGVVPIVVGGAILAFSCVSGLIGGCVMVLAGRASRQEERDEDLARELMRKPYQPKPPPKPIRHEIHRPTVVLDTAMPLEDFKRALDREFTETAAPQSL